MSFGTYQDALLGHTQNIATDKPLGTKQDTIIAHHITAHAKHDTGHSKLDTINSTLTSGIGGLTLPTALTGSGNLKVSIQELGNEGSERLNVDVGNTVSQLPTALTSEGNLKVSVQEDFTHNLSTSAKQDTQITHLSEIEGAVETLEACVGSNKVNVNISSGVSDLATESTLNIIAEEFTKCDTDNVVITGGVVLPASLTGSGNLKVCLQELGNEGSERLNVDVGDDITQLPSALSGGGRLKIENDFDGAITNTHLTELGTAINSAKVDVNISSGNISGFATATLQAGGLPSALSSDNLKVSLKETITVPVSNGALTELADAINSNRGDVNNANGGVGGAITKSG